MSFSAAPIRLLAGMISATDLASLCLILLVAAPGSSEAGTQDPVRLYVAASTREVVEAIATRFQSETGVAVEVSPGPSSKLAKQIAEGATADLFLSADQANADYLGDKQLVAERRNLVGNRLVVVVPADSPLKLEKLDDLARDDVKEIALALEKVPAGEYAREALRQVGVWERVQAKVIGGEDVRATLAFVERGASAGIVYVTDTIGSSGVRVAVEIDPTLHRPIEYPLIVIKREPVKPRALELYEYLGSAPAAELFRGASFAVLP